jgi:predicted PurR-regulated permease PerM
VPGLIDEFQHIRDELPGWANEVELRLRDFGVEVDLEERARNINWADILSGRAVDYGQQVLFTLFAILTIIVMTVYLLIDAPRLTRWVYQFVPPGKEDDAARLLRSLTRVVGGYVRGQFITSGIIAGYTFIVLTVVGVLLSLPVAAAGRVILDYSMERRLLGIPVNPAYTDEQVLAPDREPDPVAEGTATRSETPPAPQQDVAS